MITAFLNRPQDCSLIETRTFIKKSMKVLEQIILNTHVVETSKATIQNIDGFKILLSLLGNCTQYRVLQEAVLLLTRLLLFDTKNMLIFTKALGFHDLHLLLIRILFPTLDPSEELNHSDHFFKEIGGVSKIPPILKYRVMRKDVEEEEQTIGSPKEEEKEELLEGQETELKERILLFQQIHELLSYSSFILNPFNISPTLYIYSHILYLFQINSTSMPSESLVTKRHLLRFMNFIVTDKITMQVSFDILISSLVFQKVWNHIQLEIDTTEN